MQNDIVKPPTQPEENSNLPQAVPVGGDVHVQPSAQGQTLAAPAAPTAPTPENTAPDQQSATQLSTVQKPKRKKPLAAILIAGLVFLGLTGGVVYMSLIEKDKQPAATTSQTPAQSTKTDASSEIDAALNDASQLPTSNEDPANDLSDQNLGL